MILNANLPNTIPIQVQHYKSMKKQKRTKIHFIMRMILLIYEQKCQSIKPLLTTNQKLNLQLNKH